MSSPQDRADADPREVAALFDAAVDLPPGERAALLARAGAGRPELLAEVEGLLAARAEAASFLERPAVELLAGGIGEDVAEGTRAGPYRLLSELGSGGMGTVYLAERADGGFEQQVAVKVIRGGFVSAALRERFLRERQILARLEHPNIARLLDGGIAAGGSPYFAMELVRGTPLVAACDARRLSISARLELFDQACRAVQHAHANLVVHRDLKPSNMLVAEDGNVKLLDFGIAKVLSDESEDATSTRGAGHPLTPEYAAPEQLRGEVATTATDVYSLGVVLYELLTGRRPFAPPVVAAPADSASREPEPPASAVTKPTITRAGDGSSREVTPEEVAAARATTPQRLRRTLSGDLGAIVLQALQPDTRRRYPSVEALAEDLRRWRSGLPVRARPATLAYRIRKSVGRHRVAVAAAAAAAAALLAGTAVTWWQAGIAARERDAARREAARATEVQRFLVDLFENADPTETLGATITARQVLDEAARRLRREPSADLLIRAELAEALARTYRSLGLLDEAAAWAAEASEDFGRALGPAAPRTALADLTRAEVRRERGEIQEARAAIDALLPRLEAAFGTRSAEHIRARTLRIALLSHTGEAEKALAEERVALEDTRRLYGENDLKTAQRLGSLGAALAILSRFPEAAAAMREARSRMQRLGAIRTPEGIRLETSLADVLDRMGSLEAADPLFRSALANAREVLGPRNPRVGEILIKQGFLLLEFRRYDEARAALEEAISIFEPLGHYRAAVALRYLGHVHLEREHFAEAAGAYARAERSLRGRLGDDDPMTWAAVASVAFAEARRGDLAGGEARLREAVTAIERIHGADSDDARVPRRRLGEVLRLAGKYDEAEALHRRGLEVDRKLFGGEDNLNAAGSKHQLALDLLESGRRDRLAEARHLADEALAVVRTGRPDATKTGETLTTSGRIAAAQGDLARARRELGEAVELLRADRGEDAPSTRLARSALASLRQ
jgi:serine/threonine-protein kinase